MVPIYLDPRVVDRTRKFTPLVELIPRVTNQGMYADYNVITAKGGGYVAAEDAATPETTDTYERASTPIKFLYAVGRITDQMQAAMPSYILEGFQPTGEGLGGGSPFGSVAAPNAKQMEVLLNAKTSKITEICIEMYEKDQKVHQIKPKQQVQRLCLKGNSSYSSKFRVFKGKNDFKN